MFKVGFQTIVFGTFLSDLEAALDIIAGAGYRGVEFSQCPEYIHVRVGHCSRSVNPEEMHKLLAKYGLEFLGISGGAWESRLDFCSQGGLKPQYLYVEDCTPHILCEAIRREIRMAFHSHAFMKNRRIWQARKLLEDYKEYDSWQDRLSDDDRKICEENPARWKRYGRLYWMPDTAHIQIVGDNVEAALEVCDLERLIAIHLKGWDASYGRSYHRYSRGFTELSHLNAQLEKAVDFLNKSSYNGWVIVEQDHARRAILPTACDSMEWLVRNISRTKFHPREDAKTKFFRARATKRQEEYRRTANSWTAPPAPKPLRETTEGVVVDTNNIKVREKFRQSLIRAAGADLKECYSRISAALRLLCDAHCVAVWAYDPHYETLTLLSAATLYDLGERDERIINVDSSLLGYVVKAQSIQFLPLTARPGGKDSKHQFVWQDFAEKSKAEYMVGIPVMNRFNPHHVRLIVGILPKDVQKGSPLLESPLPDSPRDTPPCRRNDVPVIIGEDKIELSAEDLLFIAQDLALVADASLDDQFARAEAAVNEFVIVPTSLQVSSPVGRTEVHNIYQYGYLARFLKNLLEHVQDSIGCEAATIFLVNGTGDRLEVAATTGIEWMTEGAEWYPKNTEHFTNRVWFYYDSADTGSTSSPERQGATAFPSGTDMLPGLAVDLAKQPASSNYHHPRSTETTGVTAERKELLFGILRDSERRIMGLIRCRNKVPPSDPPLSEVMGAKRLVGPAVFNYDDVTLLDAICQEAAPHIGLYLIEARRAISVARLTHQIAMPLTQIRNALQFLRHDIENGKQGAEFTFKYAEEIEAWTNLLLAEVSNADLYGQSGANASSPPTLGCRPTDIIAEVITPATDDVAKLLEDRTVERHQITIQEEEFARFRRLDIDRARLRLVFYNLLSNAIRYCGPEPERLSIVIGARSGEASLSGSGFVEIYCQDTGLGIPKEQGESIFENGVRGRNAVQSHVAGMGVGLWLVRRIVEAHGGVVWVSNHQGPTEITLSLPVSRIVT